MRFMSTNCFTKIKKIFTIIIITKWFYWPLFVENFFLNLILRNEAFWFTNLFGWFHFSFLWKDAKYEKLKSIFPSLLSREYQRNIRKFLIWCIRQFFIKSSSNLKDSVSDLLLVSNGFISSARVTYRSGLLTFLLSYYSSLFWFSWLWNIFHRFLMIFFN